MNQAQEVFVPSGLGSLQKLGADDKNMSYISGPKKNEPADIDINEFMQPTAVPLESDSDKQKDIAIIN